jgi:membrane protein
MPFQSQLFVLVPIKKAKPDSESKISRLRGFSNNEVSVLFPDKSRTKDFAHERPSENSDERKRAKEICERRGMHDSSHTEQKAFPSTKKSTEWADPQFFRSHYESVIKVHRQRERRVGLGPTLGDRRSHTDINPAVLGARLHIIRNYWALIADPLFVLKSRLTHNLPARQIDNTVTKPDAQPFGSLEQNSARVINLKGLWLLTRDAFFQWIADNPFQMRAALAYYTLFSMAPILLIAIAVAGLVFGREASQNQMIGVIEDLVGAQSSRAIQAIIESAGQRPGSGFFATAIGLILLLLGAAGVVGQLQDSLNAIWRVASKTGRGFMGFAQDRLISYSMVLGVGFLLVVSLVVTAVLSAVSGILGGFLTIEPATAHILDLVISFAFITLLFAVIYKYVPDVRIEWRDVWLGAATTSLLFSAGKFLIGFYLGHSTVTSIYGAAGSLVTLLLWFYYSSLMFFFGAELTQVYATRFGSKTSAGENASNPRPASKSQKTRSLSYSAKSR